MSNRKVSAKKLAGLDYCERIKCLESKGIKREFNGESVYKGEIAHKLLQYKQREGVTEFPVDNGVIYGMVDLLIDKNGDIIILDWKPKKDNNQKVWAGDKLQLWAYCMAFQDEFGCFDMYKDEVITAVISGYWEDNDGEIKTEEIYREVFQPIHRMKVEATLKRYWDIMNSDTPPLKTGSLKKCEKCDLKKECEKLDKVK